MERRGEPAGEIMLRMVGIVRHYALVAAIVRPRDGAFGCPCVMQGISVIYAAHAVFIGAASQFVPLIVG